MPALIKQGIDAGIIDGNVKTITGKTLAENVLDAEVFDDNVIRPMDAPYEKDGGLLVLKGNLSPLGAVVKSGGVVPEMRVHTGPARVFDSERAAMQALTDDTINKGDVIVIRYEGPKGGPGMQEMLAVTGYICGIGKDADVALITDGRFSGGSRGCAIGHIAPEAAAGGPIAFIEDGDLIKIDLDNRSLDLLVDLEVLEARKKRWVSPASKAPKRGWLAQYVRLVGPVHTGAQLTMNNN